MRSSVVISILESIKTFIETISFSLQTILEDIKKTNENR